MGWADCGNDSKGRPIGYAHEATCDHPGCDAKIDRGLGYACGAMHGEDEISCERYFCEKHLVFYEHQDGRNIRLCMNCIKLAEEEIMKTHDLKVWPGYFHAIWLGRKTFEIRIDDRGYRLGDFLKLREWDPVTREYSGRVVDAEIIYRLSLNQAAKELWNAEFDERLVALGFKVFGRSE